ncbi:MAG: GNAT family N-acetyltransferase [Bdellovibrio sp.]|nr:GNAT family N-acetyltransferase [Bdellovibrio sp.]
MTEQNDYEIQQITTEQTLPLRQKVLKPHLSVLECVNAGDDDATTYHLGLVRSGKIVSIATFIKENHPDFPAKYSYRLRGMATDSSEQGHGWGLKLLGYGVEFLEEKGCDFLWFNARIKAFSFYEKLGFQYYGPLFELDRIGPHKVMYKYLDPR